jgi:hypothetical protein
MPALPTLAELEYQMQFENGVVVRLNKAYGEYTTKHLLVVTGNNAKTVSVVKLGGNGGKYLRVPHRGLTVVPVAEVLAPEVLAA